MKKQTLDLTKHLQDVKKRKIKKLIFKPFLITLIATPLVILGVLFVNNKITLGGVPASIIGKFLRDPDSIEAFLYGDKVGLHDRLRKLGVEQEIKNYYRPKIPDEIELDRYIHQLLFNLTGYVGENYRANSQRMLILTPSGKIRLLNEIDPKAR